MIDGFTVVLVLDALQLKRSQSVKMKRFSHRSICFPPLTYRHKLWVVFVTESMTPLMQAAGMSFLQMLCGPHSIWRKLKPSETGWRAPSFTNKRSWLRWFRYLPDSSLVRCFMCSWEEALRIPWCPTSGRLDRCNPGRRGWFILGSSLIFMWVWTASGCTVSVQSLQWCTGSLKTFQYI